MTYTLHGYSTALYATWYLWEETGILFDAGDGLMSNLMSKSGKVKHVFLSHADRDHIFGLFQLVHHTTRDEFPKIYYPKDSGSFPAMRDFAARFDPHVKDNSWTGVEPGQDIYIRNDLMVRPILNGHIPVPGKIKSLTYQVFDVRRKLKKEFTGMSGEAIKNLRLEKGDEFITDEFLAPLLVYSGDTPLEDPDRYRSFPTVIHEATFLTRADLKAFSAEGSYHSTLEEVMEMAADSEIQQLILGHFSTRYAREEIIEAVRREKERLKISIPIHLILPGQTVRDILANPSL